MLQRLSQLMLVCGLVLLPVAFWNKDVLPAAQSLRSELLAEPRQEAVQRPSFEKTVGKVSYTIQPLYKYELYGLVVSRHDSETWWDGIHKEWNDHLNVADLCVVWGNNIRNDGYAAMAFSSGQFVCYAQTSSAEAIERFDPAALSNNHLLTADPLLAKRIREARVGDQIRFSGTLAEYSHSQGMPFKRGTSTIRTDTGNGACETIYIDDFDILQRGGGPWHALLKLAIGLLIAGVIAWFAAPPKVST